MKNLKASVVAFASLLGVGILTGGTIAASVSSLRKQATTTDLSIVSNIQTDTLGPGITESRIITNNTSSTDQNRCWAVTVDPTVATAKIIASYKTMTPSSWGMSTVRSQMTVFKNAGYNVVAGFNGDIYNMSTGEPKGPLVMSGVNYHSSGDSRPFFAILNDGSAVIGDNNEFDAVASKVKESVGGFWTLLKNGSYTSTYNYDTDTNPRTAVGIKADGKVIITSVDGRQSPTSCGMTSAELSDYMLSLGCVDALDLDGGGSTTYVSKNSGSSSFTCRNTPSDGSERNVSSGLLVVSNASYDGVFDHALVSPAGGVYTPESTVDFTYEALDAGGGQASLPSGTSLTWKLDSSSASLGTIDATTGVFTSNGTAGTVKAILTDGTNEWSSSIVIHDPDYIGFAESEVSLGFSKESDLGLKVQYQQQDVTYDDNDFVWTMSDDAMGSFNGNIFTSSDMNTVTGTITCTYKRNTSLAASVKAVIGQLPTIVEDFEDHDASAEGGERKATEYFASDKIGKAYCYPNGGIASFATGTADTANIISVSYVENDGVTTRGGKESLELASEAKGEPVRFGSYSMKLNYDFTNCAGKIEGACLGFPKDVEIPGKPTGVGVWMYAPEGTPNYWFRLRGYDANGKSFVKNFTPQGATGGIQKYGWNYYECDLSDCTAPLTLRAGEVLRLMYYETGSNGTLSAGSVYFDDLKFVYGANNEDLNAPVISYIKANGLTLSNNKEFTSDDISFEVGYADYKEKFARGIDPEKTACYIDGALMTSSSGYVRDDSANIFYLNNVALSNGTHAFKVMIYDKYNNVTSVTRYFTVSKADSSDASIALQAIDTGNPQLGNDYHYGLYTNKLDGIDSFSASIVLGNDFTESKVTFDEGFDGTYSYDATAHTLKVSGTRKTGATTSGAGYLCTIATAIPSDINSSVKFSYQCEDGTFTTDETHSGTYCSSFACPTVSKNIEAGLSVSSETMIIDSAGGTITVKDASGNAVEGANVYLADGTLLGTTNSSGELLTDKLVSTVGVNIIYASKGTLISYLLKVFTVNHTSGTDATVPEEIFLNGNASAASEIDVSWFSDPITSLDSSIVQYATAEAYAANGTKAFQSVSGTSYVYAFTGSSDYEENYAVKINSAAITGLSEGTSYVIRVGDGTNWSATRTVKTNTSGTDTDFFVIGDTQGDDMTNLNTILSQLQSTGTDYDFGVQLGDSMETTSVYSDSANILKEFSTGYLGSIDIIHVLGNHEYFGDTTSALCVHTYSIPDQDGNETHCYSYVYGCVYVAVINYTNDATLLAEDLAWLVEDAKASKACWKILTIHQPAYYTNVSGENEIINELVPQACKMAGINAVFSGHDHSYARTNLIDGTVYYICGSTGEKAYALNTSMGFDFAMATQDFTALYITVKATDAELDIVTHDIDTGIIDTCTLTSSSSCHASGHSYVYDKDSGKLVCSICDYTISSSSYTGLVTDKEGKAYYLKDGTCLTGYQIIDGKGYYFNADGSGFNGTTSAVDGMSRTFENGKMTTAVNGVYSDGSHLYYFDETGVKDTTQGWITYKGNYYYITSSGCLATGQVSIKVSTARSAPGGGGHTGPTSSTSYTFTFDTDGKLIKGAFTTDGHYYWGDGYYSGWLIQDGCYYYFDASNTEKSASGTVTINGFSCTFVSTSTSNLYKLSSGVLTDPSTGLYINVVNGAAASGTVSAGNTSYAFGTDGVALDGVVLTSTGYKVYSNGVLEQEINGLTTIDGQVYYYTSEGQQTGFETIDGKTYYFDPETGAAVNGIVTIDGVKYTFADHVLTEGTFNVKTTGVTYSFNGSLLTGKVYIGGAIAYIGDDGYIIGSDSTLITYDIYCLYYPSYTGTYADFNAALTAGTLDKASLPSVSVYVNGTLTEAGFFTALSAESAKDYYVYAGDFEGIALPAGSYCYRTSWFSGTYVLSQSTLDQIAALEAEIGSSVEVSDYSYIQELETLVSKLDASDQLTYAALIASYKEAYQKALNGESSSSVVSNASDSQTSQGTNGSGTSDNSNLKVWGIVSIVVASVSVCGAAAYLLIRHFKNKKKPL